MSTSLFDDSLPRIKPSDGKPADLVYQWSAGSQTGSDQPTFTYTANDYDASSATVTVTDANNPYAAPVTASFPTTVLEAPLWAILSCPDSAMERQPIPLTASAGNPDNEAGESLCYDWTVTCGQNVWRGSGPSPHYSFTPPDSGQYSVTLEVTDLNDPEAGSVTITRSASVTGSEPEPEPGPGPGPGPGPERGPPTNSPPLHVREEPLDVWIEGPTVVDDGDSVRLEGAAINPHIPDSSGGHREFNWTWDVTSPVEGVPALYNPQSGNVFYFEAQTEGWYTVTATATDPWDNHSTGGDPAMGGPATHKVYFVPQPSIPEMTIWGPHQPIDAGQDAVFTVTLLGPPSTGPVLVDYVTLDGSAHEPEDYTRQEGTLEFDSAGPQEIDVHTTLDATDVDGKDLGVLLYNLRNAHFPVMDPNASATPDHWPPTKTAFGLFRDDPHGERMLSP
jgi:hypothetical protein